MGKLTEKQGRFIDFYIETGNAAEAARRAGQPPPGATGTAVNKRHGGSATPKIV